MFILYHAKPNVKHTLCTKHFSVAKSRCLPKLFYKMTIFTTERYYNYLDKFCKSNGKDVKI